MIYRMSARTTLILDEHCLIELKRLAAAERRTLSDLVDEVLRVGLAQHKKIRKGTRGAPLPVFSMGRPSVNLADRDHLEEVMRG